MMQNKSEYENVREIIAPHRCGSYRYLPREKRIKKIQKMINQNRADVRACSFTHNLSRFPITHKFTFSTQREEEREARKLAYFKTRASSALAKVGIHIFSLSTLSLSARDEAEISRLMLRLSHSFSFEDSENSPTVSAPVRNEARKPTI